MGSNERRLTEFRKVIATEEPPLLGPNLRPGIKSANDLTRALAEYFAAERIPASLQPALRSAALLWHDDLDASHTISQDLHTREGSWLHGIMHRREPDYGNAKYWFRRVGQHEAFGALGGKAAELLHNRAGGLAGRLVENGEWLPFSFVDACERAEMSGNEAEQRVLRKIQALEFDALIEFLLRQDA